MMSEKQGRGEGGVGTGYLLQSREPGADDASDCLFPHSMSQLKTHPNGPVGSRKPHKPSRRPLPRHNSPISPYRRQRDRQSVDQGATLPPIACPVPAPRSCQKLSLRISNDPPFLATKYDILGLTPREGHGKGMTTEITGKYRWNGEKMVICHRKTISRRGAKNEGKPKSTSTRPETRSTRTRTNEDSLPPRRGCRN